MTHRPLVFAILAAAIAITAPALASGNSASRAEKGQAKLAKLLEGRTAGKPTSCILTYHNDNLQVIDGTALVYGRGRTIYVNIPDDPASLDQGDTLVVRRYGSRLCSTDIITTIDQPSGSYTGNIFLGDFVPYTKDS